MSIADKILTFKNDLDAVYEAGKAAGGVDNPLYYAGTLNNIFKEVTFPENHSMVIKLCKQVPMASAFYNARNIQNITIIADDKESKALTYSGFTWYAYNVKKVDFSQYGILKPTTVARMFYQNYPLKSIIGKFDLSENTDAFQWLNACSNLVDIEFVPNTIKKSTQFNWCPKLSDASIQSIIDGLADLTGETSQTVTFHTDVVAKLTEEQKSQIESKNWGFGY